MADFVSGYNIINKIGEGARSQVYQVIRSSTGEVFALKRVLRESHEDTRFLDQAINGYEVSRQFTHPTLRKSLDLKRIRTLFKLTEVQVIMEYIDGISLDKRRPDRIENTINLFIKLARGLDHMHHRGYLHTDIKPNNILLTYDGTVKIIDFGQSCKIGTVKPRIQGTPDYIAPEQVERHSLSQKTDIYNLGATLYWALTGQTYPTMITKQGGRQESRPSSPIPTPRNLNGDIPPILSRLVMACCEHDRRIRPKNIKEVIARLETAGDALSSKRPTSRPRPGASIPQTEKLGGSGTSARSIKPSVDDANVDHHYDFSDTKDAANDSDNNENRRSGGLS